MTFLRWRAMRVALGCAALMTACGDDPPAVTPDAQTPGDATGDTSMPPSDAADVTVQPDAPADVQAPDVMDASAEVGADATPADASDGGGDAGDGARDASDASPMDAGDGGVDVPAGPDASDGSMTGDGSMPPDAMMMTGLRAHRGTSLVSAGAVTRSAGFRMVSTVGQPSVHVGTMRSGAFRLRGGLVGATGGR